MLTQKHRTALGRLGLATLFVLVGSPAQAQENRELIEARHLERIEGDPGQALALYTKILDQSNATPEQQEEALAGQIRCLLSLGDLESAEAAYLASTPEFRGGPRAIELAVLLGQEGSGQAVDANITEKRIQALLENIDDDSGARFKLQNMGDLAVPSIGRFLATSKDSQLLQQASRLLAHILHGNPNGEALAYFRGLEDESDVFAVASGLDALQVCEPIPDALHDMIRSLAKRPIPLIQKSVTSPLARIGETDLVLARITPSDPLQADLAFGAVMANSPDVLPEAARRMMKVRDPYYAAKVVTPLIEAGETALLDEALAHPNLRIRKAMWQAAARTVCEKQHRHQARKTIASICQSPRTICGRLVELARSPEGADLARNNELSLSTDTLPFTTEEAEILIANWGSNYETHLARSFDLNDDAWLKKSEYTILVWEHHMGTPEASTAVRRILSQPDLMQTITLAAARNAHKELHDASILREVAERLDWNITDWLRALYGFANSDTQSFIDMLVGTVQEEGYSQRLLNILQAERVPNFVRSMAWQNAGSLADDDPLRDEVWRCVAENGDKELRDRALRNLPKSKPLPTDIVLTLVRRADGDIAFPLLTASRLIQVGQDPVSVAREVFTLAYADSSLKDPVLQHLMAIVIEDPEELRKTREWVASLWEKNPRDAWDIVHRLPDFSDDDLEQALVHAERSSHTRGAVLLWIRNSHRTDLAPVVASLLKQERNPTYKAVAIQTLVAFRAVDSASSIVQYLTDESGEVRKAAQDGLETLHRYLEEKQRWSRLESGGSALSPLDQLIKQTQSAELEIRLLAIHSLVTLGDPEALPHLIELLQDDHADVQEAAREAVMTFNAKK